MDIILIQIPQIPAQHVIQVVLHVLEVQPHVLEVLARLDIFFITIHVFHHALVILIHSMNNVLAIVHQDIQDQLALQMQLALSVAQLLALT